MADVDLVRQVPVILRSDPARVVIRPFVPADDSHEQAPRDRSRAQRMADRVLGLEDGALQAEIVRVSSSLAERHRDVAHVLLRRFHEVNGLLIEHVTISDDQALLIGAYETVFAESDELLLTFEQAEQFRTPKYLRSVEATFEAKRQLGGDLKAQPKRETEDAQQATAQEIKGLGKAKAEKAQVTAEVAMLMERGGDVAIDLARMQQQVEGLERVNVVVTTTVDRNNNEIKRLEYVKGCLEQEVEEAKRTAAEWIQRSHAAQAAFALEKIEFREEMRRRREALRAKEAEVSPKTKADYRKLMAAISDHPMKVGTFGQRLASAVDAEAADKLYSLFQTRGERQATYAMQVCRLVWNWAVRYSKTTKVEVNPFAKMALNHRVSSGNWPVGRKEYEAYRRAAANLGYHSMALAAALSFELVQRVSDCFGFEDPADADSDGDAVRDERGIRWSDYQCKKSIVVRQHKTKKRLVIPLVDDRFSPPISLYPELEEGLEQAYELGADGLIVVEERNGKPYKPRRMSSVHRKICEAAGLPKKLTFTSFRHGGATELGDAGETDIRSISGHTQIDTSLIYNKASQQKAREIALRRREYVRLISNTPETGEDDD